MFYITLNITSIIFVSQLFIIPIWPLLYIILPVGRIGSGRFDRSSGDWENALGQESIVFL